MLPTIQYYLSAESLRSDLPPSRLFSRLKKSCLYGSVLVGSLFMLANVQADNLPAGLNQLPAYDNPQAINNLLGRNQPPQYVEGIPPSLLQQLQQLQQTQQQLLQQLAQQGASSPGNNNAANNSNIFFTNNSNAASSTPAVAPTPANTAAKPGGTTASTDQVNQNPVQQQLNFISQDNDQNTNENQVNPNTIQPAASPYLIQAGAFIPAVLQTAINSDVPGQVSALITQDIYDTPSGKFLLIPKGSRIIGLYNSDIPYGGTRVQVKFTRLIRPDGSSIVLTGPLGVNPAGESGLMGDVDNHWGRIIGSGALSALFTMPAIVATQQQSNQNCTTNNGVTTCTPSTTLGGTALAASASTVSQFGSTIASKSLNIQPTLTLPAGTLFNVFVNKDMVITPANGS